MTTTARDLAVVARDLPAGRTVDRGDLSLALAGAELLDLAAAGAAAAEGDRIVPGPPTATGDPLLDGAVAALVREEPFETVEDWLWRRGLDLATAYDDDLVRLGLAARP
ncbi:GPP34 family phosphoprotein, partial [Streptomyces sp. SID5785]|uniref:GPP34 family phosphoprotein n=1 Tax=Streptomyces sp. SID5785 TaxID=2690309 RepID=UPI00136100DA